jgi:hypothetical protein
MGSHSNISSILNNTRPPPNLLLIGGGEKELRAPPFIEETKKFCPLPLYKGD